jgi:uncharacterized protein (DUF924 family)
VAQLLQFQSYIPAFRARFSTAVSPKMSNPDIQRVLSFWYGMKPMEWFQPKPGFDDECMSTFGDLVSKAVKTQELDAWAAEPQGAVALVILLDQLTRNIYRGTADAFSGDDKAKKVAELAIAKGFDHELDPLKAIQLYTALIHQESILAQIAAKAMFENLRAKVPLDYEYRDFVDKSVWAVNTHMEMILKFGRYPGRNEILGRESTPEEVAYLNANPQANFGQAKKQS